QSSSNCIRVPASAAGTTTRLTQGMAMILASGELKLPGIDQRYSQGQRPMNTTHWARPQRHQRPLVARRDPIPQSSKATATKDSQNPARSGAAGLYANTAATAMSHRVQSPG